MSNVISLSRPERLLWVCSCGCSTHRVFTTGDIECAACARAAAMGSQWVKEELPEPPTKPDVATKESRVITITGSPRSAIRHMLSVSAHEDLIALIAIGEDSRVRTWGGVDTELRAEWLDRRLAEARDLLSVMVPKPK